MKQKATKLSSKENQKKKKLSLEKTIKKDANNII